MKDKRYTQCKKILSSICLLIILFLLNSCASTAESPKEEPVPERGLIRLVQDQDREAINELFGLHIDLDQTDEQGKTPLHLAAQAGDTQTAAILLERGANPNKQDRSGKTALHVAVAESHDEIAALLAAGGADLFIEDETGQTTLAKILVKEPALYTAVLIFKNVNQHDGNHNTPLHHGTKTGLLSVVEHLLQVGADTQLRNNKNKTPLDIALQYPNSIEHARVAKYLITWGSPRPLEDQYLFLVRTVETSSWDLRFENKETALHIASRGGWEGIAALLLENDADIEAIDRAGVTALHVAASEGHQRVVGQLLEAGADASSQDINGNGVFHYALLGPEPEEMLPFLLQRGVDPDIRNAAGNSAMHLILQHGLEINLIRLLLDNGGDPDIRNTAGAGPLLEAIRRENRTAAELLIERGASVFAADKKGRSPVSEAISQGVETLEWFVSSAGEKIRDENGNNLLHYAAGKNHHAETQYLVGRNVSVHERNRNGDTPLHVAMQQITPPTARVLIEAGADLFMRNDNKRSPLTIVFSRNDIWWDNFFVPEVLSLRDSLDNTILHHAVMEGNVGAVSGLLELRVGPDARNRKGHTPLHKAVQLGDPSITKLLLEAGVDVSVGNMQSNRALHLLNGKAGVEIGQQLLAAGADIDSKNEEGRTPLRKSVRNNELEIASMLISQGAQVNIRDNQGRTPLFDAAQTGSIPMAEILASAGASIHFRDYTGHTPLHIAVMEGRLELCALAAQEGADIFAENVNRQSVVEMAFERGVESVAAIVDRQQINAQNNKGNSVVHLAVLSAVPAEVLEYLLTLDPDLTLRNANGLRPIDIARQKGLHEHQNILSEHL